MKIDIKEQTFKKIAGADITIEKILTGFCFTEGPVWHPYDKHLTFSDIICNTIYRWNDAAGLTIFRQPSYLANGNTFDRHGRLLTCEHGTSRVSRQNSDGTVEVLASRFEGKELNSPNDIVIKSNGDIYFTDPNYGRGLRAGIPRQQELPVQGVYRLRPETGELTLLTDQFKNPNGLCFSLDEQRLFINDSPTQQIHSFAVQPDGTLADGQLWAVAEKPGIGAVDGMKFDSEGNLYCCGPGGIYLFDTEANWLGHIEMPEQTANLAWGDDDLRTLYITASTSIYRTRVNIPGVKLF